MRRLVVGCDGTWQSEAAQVGRVSSNIVKTINAVAEESADGTQQLSFYQAGVGTSGLPFERLLGGAMGVGLDDNIRDAYQWLGTVYQPGDQIFLFGFSRGAYTARSLAGFIGACGLLTGLGDVSESVAKDRIKAAFGKGYKNRKPRDQWANNNWPVVDPEIHFLGVFDTVGSLGIPDNFGFLNLLDNPDKYTFHDTNLGPHVVKARHAVAIDEMRSSFMPTLWTDANDDPLNDTDDDGRVRQIWFTGVHSDIGGSYPEAGLSNTTLEWMLEAAQASGLAFKPASLATIKPDAMDMLHDSLQGAYQALGSRPRNIRPFTRNDFHPTAIARHMNPPTKQTPYHPKTVLLAAGESSPPLPIDANKHWNETGVYLQGGGTYEFTATGQWSDGGAMGGPQGKDLRGPIGWGQWLWDSFESTYRWITRNPRSELYGTRRVDSMPWMALIGVITNDSGKTGVNPTNDGSPFPHQQFLVGAATTTPVTIKDAGFFYAFANDAWHLYANNKGSVSVIVRRVS